MTKGERLHNPFDIEKNSNIHWQGQIANSPEPVFVEFESDLYGLRAGFINLKNQLTEGFNTIQKLITKFAPPSENDTKAYIEAVCKRMDKNPDDVLTLTDLKCLGISIIYQEQSRCLYGDDTINAALILAGVETHANPLITNGNTTFMQWLRNVLASILPGRAG
jgi:hypothetical protein